MMDITAGRLSKKKCCVPDCDGQGTTIFHKFPSDAVVKRKWVETCNITKHVTCNNYVCSKHFVEEDYSCLKPKRLRRYVVPSKRLTRNYADLEEFEPEKETAEKQNDADAEISRFVEIDVPSRESQEDVNISTTGSQLEEAEEALLSNIVKKVCCVPQCHAKPSDNRVLHNFPKLKRVALEWFTACNLSQPLKHPLYVCNAHFCKEDYLNLSSTKLILKSTAVPSLNMPRKPKFKVVIKEENEEESSSNTNDGRRKEKITTIIYVPKHCKSVIAPNSGHVQIVKTLDSISSPKQKSAPRVLQNHNTVKTAIQQKRVALKSPSNINNQIKSYVQKKKELEKKKQYEIQSNEQKKQQLNKNKQYKESDDIEMIGEHLNNDLNLQNTNSNVALKKKEKINIAAEKHVTKQHTLTKNQQIAKEQSRKNVSAITLCAGCGQYTTIDDEDLKDIRKSPETLAAEALLELQEVNPPNEDEGTAITKKGIEICDRVIQKKVFSLLGLLNTDLELMAFTGINLSLLEKLTKAVTIAEGPKCVAKTFHPPRERIVLCLCKLRTNLTFRSLAAMFGLTQIVCSSYFFAMVRTLAGILQYTIHWTKTEELLKNLPKAFQSFKQTRVILNCTETQIEKQRCQKCMKDLTDQKKDYESVKFVLGVAPNGLIIFNSKTYDAQAEDTSIFTQTALLNHLDPVKEAVMADSTLNIEAECVERNITLIKAPKLGKNKQYSSSDVELIKNVCAARVHVDRTLQRFKMYKILQTKISWRILPYLDDVCTVVAGIVNMKNPILPDDVHLTKCGLKI